MTDKQIIKLLKNCSCLKCPLSAIYNDDKGLLKNALDLINRQKAQIERLEKENAKQKAMLEAIDNEMLPLPFETDFDKAIKTAKSEAIKEFAEKFSKELSEFDMSSVGLPDYDRGYKDCMTAIEDTIDNLVKEMTEEEK